MKLLIVYSLALLTLPGTRAQGLIWSANSSSGNNGAAPGGSWQIAFDNVPDPSSPISPSLNPMSGIFSMSISTNDASRTFFANPVDEPGFLGFVAGLTDGSNGWIRFQDGSPFSYLSQTECGFLGRSAAAPDLAGYNITQIGFRVNNFYDYFDVQEDRYFRQLDYSLDFYGAPVPEPSTWALLGLGGATAVLLRKKRLRTRARK